MCDKYYATPKPKQTALFKTPRRDNVPMEGSESDDSIHSQHSAQSTDSSCNGDLTIVAEYDELSRLSKEYKQTEVEDAMLDLVHHMREMKNHLQMTREECKRLQLLVDERTHSLSDIESKLNFARKMVDAEKRRSKKIQDEKDELQEQIQKVKEFLFKDNRGVLREEAHQKLAFLNVDNMFDPNLSYGHQLGAIPEVNTTGSLLSDFSYSRSEDDLDTSIVGHGRTWMKPRQSSGPEPPIKKRRSSAHQRVVEINNTDSVRATTTLTVPKNGPITATSIIESVPQQDDRNIEPLEAHTPTAPAADIIFDMWSNNMQSQERNNGLKPTQRQHSLQSKTVVLPDTCGPCEKKLRFGKTALKCKDCRVICHPECKQNLPMPCIPYVNTPTRNLLGLISDYTPTIAPMVPALIVHCLNEIEARGLHEMGLYRIPGSEREVKQLKEKFLRGKCPPNIKDIEIPVICGTVKAFLRNLHESLITFKLWPRFVECVTGDQQTVTAELYRLINELPQPNRDTLAYMVLHMRKIAESPDCKMPISNLSKIFGPTIVGYSITEPKTQEMLFMETQQQNLVMEAIMNLPLSYWSSFITDYSNLVLPRLQQTPSTDSLLRPTSRMNFTPHALNSAKRKHRIFNTPPTCKY